MTVTVGLSGGLIQLSGSNYVSPMEVLLGDVVITQPNVVVVNSSTLLIKTPPLPVGTYHLTTVDPDGRFAMKLNAVQYANLPPPVWITASKLPTTTIGSAVSYRLVANNAVEYRLDLSSTLPNNLSFYANGLVSGSITSTTANTYTFTAVAISNQGVEANRTFSFEYGVSPMPTWTTIANPLGTSGFTLQSVTNATLSGIHHRVAVSGITGSPNGRVITSSDGGRTWQIRTAAATAIGNFALWAAGPKLSPTVDLSTVSTNLVVVGGDNGKLATSTDLNTWTARTIIGWPTTSSVRDIVYSHTYRFYMAAGTNGAIATSSDGITWRYNNSIAAWPSWGINLSINTLSVDTQGRIWAGGQSGKLAVTTTGTSWSLEPITAANLWGINPPWSTGENVNVVLFGRDNTMVIAGSLGTIAYPSAGWKYAENLATIKQGGGWNSGWVQGSTYYLVGGNRMGRSIDGGRTWTISTVGTGTIRSMTGPVLLGPDNVSRQSGQNLVVVGTAISFSNRI